MRVLKVIESEQARRHFKAHRQTLNVALRLLVLPERISVSIEFQKKNVCKIEYITTKEEKSESIMLNVKSNYYSELVDEIFKVSGLSNYHDFHRYDQPLLERKFYVQDEVKISEVSAVFNMPACKHQRINFKVIRTIACDSEGKTGSEWKPAIWQ